jgi:hypothetical protein
MTPHTSDTLTKLLHEVDNSVVALSTDALKRLTHSEVLTLVRHLLDQEVDLLEKPGRLHARARFAQDILERVGVPDEKCFAELLFVASSDSLASIDMCRGRVIVAEVIRSYLSGEYCVQPTTEGLTYLWGLAVGRADPAITTDIFLEKPSWKYSWSHTWRTLTAHARFSEALTLRQRDRAGFVTQLARKNRDRRVLAEVLIDTWAGSLAELDETITTLVARGADVQKPAAPR